MQLPCVIMRDNMFFAGIFTFLVCLRFKFKFFNPSLCSGLQNLNLTRKKNKKVKITTKHNFPNDNKIHNTVDYIKLVNSCYIKMCGFFLFPRNKKENLLSQYKMLLICLETNKNLIIPQIMKLGVKMRDKILLKLNKHFSMSFFRTAVFIEICHVFKVILFL